MCARKVDPNAGRNGAIVFSILLTLGFTLALVAFLSSDQAKQVFASADGDSPSPLVLGALYLVCHPIIGRILVYIAESEARFMRSTYRMEQAADWSLASRMLFGAAWPIVGIPSIVVLFIIIVFGMLYAKRSEPA
jgi:ABC-type antimicrobial peptide transport system permease subunit